jgi:predicted kinase
LEDPIKRAEDKLFAERVSSSREGATLQFHTPWKFFGESDKYRRKAAQESQLPAYDAPPPTALQTRAALLGGYLQGPILLIVCGAQGCGKSTFCKRLAQDENSHWIHLSQDTISDGKPGKRQAVQEAALDALRNHHSVVIDRTHLDPEQRLHFIQVAQRANVPVHAVVLHASRSELVQRVRDRTDHPAGVQGDTFVKLAVQSLETMVTPTYEEGLALISISASTDAANNLADLYRRTTVFPNSVLTNPLPSRFCLYKKKDEPSSVLPSIAMGSYKLGKRVATSVVTLAATNGIHALGTAPTYDDEESIGDAIGDSPPSYVRLKAFAVDRPSSIL